MSYSRVCVCVCVLVYVCVLCSLAGDDLIAFYCLLHELFTFDAQYQVFALRFWYNSTKASGRWNASKSAAWWSFFVGEFVGRWWVFAAWLLFKKAVLTIIVNLTHGPASAACALTLQLADTVLICSLQPFAQKGINRSEIIGGVTNLLAFGNIAIPLLAPDLAPAWMTDLVSMILAMAATVVAAVGSLLALLSDVALALMAAVDFCSLPSSSAKSFEGRRMELDYAACSLIAHDGITVGLEHLQAGLEEHLEEEADTLGERGMVQDGEEVDEEGADSVAELDVYMDGGLTVGAAVMMHARREAEKAGESLSPFAVSSRGRDTSPSCHTSLPNHTHERGVVSADIVYKNSPNMARACAGCRSTFCSQHDFNAHLYISAACRHVVLGRCFVWGGLESRISSQEKSLDAAKYHLI